MVSPNDVISVEKEGNLFFRYSETGTRRDGSEVELTPLSGTAPGPGKFLKTAKGLKVLGEAAKASTKLWPAVSNGRIVINGIEYTTHALERMQPVGTIMKGTKVFSRGVPPSVVENAIKFGKVTPGNTAAEVVRTFENVRVITNPQGTRVISIIKMGH